MDQNGLAVQSSYDLVAQEYAERIFHELDDKPLDREWLDRFALKVRGLGPVCDMGCGPGHVARYLHDRGIDVFGIDLSPGMVTQAQQLNPGIEFKQGNMLALEAKSETWGAIVAFYSLIHIPREKVNQALQELRRVLQPNGLLLLAFHVGRETVHIDEWWGKVVSLDFTYFQQVEMESYLRTAGFEIEDAIERSPYEGVEHQSRRVYILARKQDYGRN